MDTQLRIEPRILEGDHVRLEPLSDVHKDGLCEAILDGKLWEIKETMVPPPEQIDGFVADSRKMFESGAGLAFATIEKAPQCIAGSTRFMHADLPNKRLEIGFTFLGKSWQRTRINTEAKLLMLTHAFEVLEMNRVELLTDSLNEISKAAILRIGAKQEGLLRNHMIMRDGRMRDSLIFSIIRNEWPEIKQDLQGKLT